MAITSLSEFSINQWLPKRNNLRSSYIGNITYITSAKLSSSTQAPPSGTQTGDFVLVVGVRDDSAAVVPTGFTTLFNTQVSSTNYTISYRFWQSGDTAIQLTLSGDLDYVYAAYVFRNVGSVAESTPTPVFTNTGQNQVSFPAITTTSQNNMLLRIAMIDEGYISSITYPSPWNFAALYTTGALGVRDNSVSVALGYYEAPIPTTVAADTYLFSPTVDQGDNNGATIALIPAGV